MGKVNVYDIVTERIMGQLEKGIVPWHRPWVDPVNRAYSRSTGKAYSFLNSWLLEEGGEYVTYNQLKAVVYASSRAEKAVALIMGTEKNA